eukprot:4526550-Amphidinium_carterae.1
MGEPPIYELPISQKGEELVVRVSRGRYLRVLPPELLHVLLDHFGRRLPGASCHHLHSHPLGDQLGHGCRYADDDLRVTINCGTVDEDSREVVLTSRDPRLLRGGLLVEGR